MASEVNEVLQGLSSKFETLISLYEKSRMECDGLRMDKENAEKTAQEQTAKITALEDKNKNMLVSHAFAKSSESNEEAKDKINKIVREIDKCILLLNK